MVKMLHATYLCTKNCKFTTGLNCDYHELSQKNRNKLSFFKKKNEDRILLRIAFSNYSSE